MQTQRYRNMPATVHPNHMPTRADTRVSSGACMHRGAQLDALLTREVGQHVYARIARRRRATAAAAR